MSRLRESECADRLKDLMFDDFPRDAERLGASGVSAVVRLGIAQTRRHRRYTERDMYLYLTMMFMIGSYFDEDPQLPWAKSMLEGDGSLDRLHDRTLDHLDMAAGEENEHVIRALVRARSQELASLPQITAPDFEMQTVKLLEYIYPTKFRIQGHDASVEAVRLAVTRAQQYGMPSGAPLLAMHALLLGAGFDRDPVHPWIQDILTAPLDGDSKLKALHHKGIEFADSVLQ